MIILINDQNADKLNLSNLNRRICGQNNLVLDQCDRHLYVIDQFIAEQVVYNRPSAIIHLDEKVTIILNSIGFYQSNCLCIYKTVALWLIKKVFKYHQNIIMIINSVWRLTMITKQPSNTRPKTCEYNIIHKGSLHFPEKRVAYTYTVLKEY